MAAVNSISGSTDDGSGTISVPAWWSGVPQIFHKMPSYFRNINIEDLVLEFGTAKSDLSEQSIALVNKHSKPNKRKERPLVKITLPIVRIKWPNLHKTGDYPEVEKSTLGSANFSSVIYEGDIPDDMLAKFPELEREQKAAFDFCERLYKHVLRLMYLEPSIRTKQKADTLKNALKYVKNQDDKEQMEEIMKDVEQQFYDRANADDKKKYDFVRRDPEHYPGEGRYMLVKKGVSSKITDAAKIADPKKLKIPPPLDDKHYVSQLFADKKEYTPPCILNGKGQAIDLGLNEEPLLESKDLVIPSFFVKVTDCTKGYGSRPLYAVFQLVRKVKPEEIESGGTDLGDLADEYDPFAAKSNKKKEEEYDPFAAKTNKRSNAEASATKVGIAPPVGDDQGPSRKNKPAAASPPDSPAQDSSELEAR